MATGTAGDTARLYQMQVVHSMRWNVTYSNEGTAVDGPNRLPANAIVVGGGVHITTAFDDSATIDVGFRDGSSTDDPNAYATALTATAIGYIVLDALGGTANIMQTSSFIPTATVNDGTGSVSAGSAEVVLFYVVDNDA